MSAITASRAENPAATRSYKKLQDQANELMKLTSGDNMGNLRERALYWFVEASELMGSGKLVSRQISELTRFMQLMDKNFPNLNG